MTTSIKNTLSWQNPLFDMHRDSHGKGFNAVFTWSLTIKFPLSWLKGKTKQIWCRFMYFNYLFLTLWRVFIVGQIDLRLGQVNFAELLAQGQVLQKYICQPLQVLKNHWKGKFGHQIYSISLQQNLCVHVSFKIRRLHRLNQYIENTCTWLLTYCGIDI